jgi:hypothetical protein
MSLQNKIKELNNILNNMRKYLMVLTKDLFIMNIKFPF